MTLEGREVLLHIALPIVMGGFDGGGISIT
jgi:hypothetical protein